MYKIIGADGKEYGPVSLEQLKQWVAQGRINTQTRIQPAGADWKMAGELPELAGVLPVSVPRVGPAPAFAPASTAFQKTGLAVTSLVLGISSVLCLMFLTGIPAIICGHIAFSRARRSPAQYGGSGMALAGLIMGYLSLVLSVLVAAMLLPAVGHAKTKAQQIQCTFNLMQIGVGLKMWSQDHQNRYPFNVSTNDGGTLELCVAGPDGFDKNAFLHFMVLSNELSTPRVLVCQQDPSKQAAANWKSLKPGNVSYKLRSGTNIDGSDPKMPLVVCPIHGHVLKADGTVDGMSRSRRKSLD